MSALQTDIERRLAHSEPDVEVLLAEVLGGRCLRVYIDHPDGVTLAVCERVTALLSEERERYSLEVSSPGSERPLTKPAHFRRFVGRRARVRTRHPRAAVHADGQRRSRREARAELHRRARGGLRGRGHARRRRGRHRDPLLGHPSFEPDRGIGRAMSREILEAMYALAREKGIEPEKLMLALEDALLSAYKKQPGSAKYARVEMDRETADFRVIELIIPERLEAHLIVETIDEETTIDPETGEMREPEEPEIDPKKFAEYRDQIDERDVTPDDFGRIAAQTAKQVILQRIREAERDMMYEEYRDRVGELITGIVQQSDSRYTLVQLRERVEALLPKSEQVEGERYDHSQRIKAVIKEVSPSTKGPAIIVSRRDPELIKKLFELEVPEIADGLVEIANVAREPGYRSKIAVISHTDGVDPVGACVGPRGSRVRMVVSELRGEKIDIIPFNDEPARFVAKALSPARVREVLVDDDAKQATVIVPDDQLSLAIGREGQNARLAARLTGWRVDIRSETEFAAEEAEHGYEEEEVQGRCAAILSNGRRCPNASLPGSRYCGLDSHQALAEHRNRQRRRPRSRGRRRRQRRRRSRGHGEAVQAPVAGAAFADPAEQLHAQAPQEAAEEQAAIGVRPGGHTTGSTPSARGAARGASLAPGAAASAAGGSRRSPSWCAWRRSQTARAPRRRAVLDRAGTMPGRGAYLCQGRAAGEPVAGLPALATRRGGIARALRCRVTIDPELVESVSR